MAIKVGILLPRSVIYPYINFDLVNGLKAGLAYMGGEPTEVKTENVALGADDKLIYGQCEKLIFEGCSVIAGYVSPGSAEKLEPLLSRAGVIFLCLDAGYHFPATLEKQAHVFYVSLQGALCCQVIARKAAEDGILKMAYTCSYYETGYRSTFALHNSLEAAGGQITYNHIGKLKRSEYTLDPLVEHLSIPGTDGVLASYCGDMMEDFFTTAAVTDAFKDHPLYGSSFMGEEEWLAKSPYPGVDVAVCVPWATALDNTENAAFKTALQDRANVFSLLGWEAGLLASQAATVREPGGRIKMLEGFSFDSPRGHITISATTHWCHAPVYDARVVKDEATGECRLDAVAPSSYTEEQRTKLDHIISSDPGPFTSWFNAYACLDS